MNGALTVPAITPAMARRVKSPKGRVGHRGISEAPMANRAPSMPPAKIVGAKSPATPPPEFVA